MTRPTSGTETERPQRGGEADLDSVTIPALIIAGVNAYVLWNEHWSHWEHMAPLEERPEYPYQNLRTKNYFWGNGDKVSPRLVILLVECWLTQCNRLCCKCSSRLLGLERWKVIILVKGINC